MENMDPILCNAEPCTLSLDSVIAVGFGDATITRNGKKIFSEHDLKDNEYMYVRDVEKLAQDAPQNTDWRIHYYGPLSETHYQRQGKNLWVLYEKDEGFA